jgi:hypothetical protein
MRPLLEWLGEPWSDQVLAHHEVQPSSGAAGEVEGFTRTDTPIDTSRVDTWRDFLRGPDLERVSRRTGALAGFLGYDPRQPAPSRPWSTGGLVTGTELAARQAADPAGINWSRRLSAPAPDRPLRPPPPKQRQRSAPGGPSLDDVSVRDVVRHRVLGWAHRRLPDDLRHRANDVRRKNARIDRIIGPR